MHYQKNEIQAEDEKIILYGLAHHDPKREDFKDHVLYIFNYAVCIGCFSFVLGAIVALVIGNLFYYYIVNFINISVILLIFFICWIPSIFQYSVQIITKKPLKNRRIKFLIRFLYPIGSIIFAFKTPIWGLSISIIAGYLIIYIRKIKNKTLNKKITPQSQA